MTVTPPEPQPTPDPQPAADRRRYDELIAVVVALFGIGSVVAWSLTRSNQPIDLGSALQAPLFSTGTATPTASPSVGIAVPLPGTTPGNAPTATGSAPVAVVPLAPSPTPVESSPTAIPSTTAVNGAPAPVPVPVPAQPASPAASPPVAAVPPAQPAVSSFTDVTPDYWAYPFIMALTQRGIIQGFPGNRFRPDTPVTRAEFAVMLQKALDQPAIRGTRSFSDVPSTFWGLSAINKTVQMGFLNGYPDGTFRPNQPIPKTEALVSMATGLQLSDSANSANVLSAFQDRNQVPAYALPKVAAATQAGLVVNYPARDRLKPDQAITRADAAALIYQTLVHQGQAQKIESQAIVPPQ